MSTPRTDVAVRATASAALLYWLVLLCGLEGLTIVRVDTPHLGALWVGSIAGVALGQLVGWLRVRGWLLVVLMMGGLWLTPMVYNIVFTGLDSSVETLFCAFIPAAICGYLALSERGALVAFWYPAVLWMLVILDGPGAFQLQTAVPFGVGLAALFIAFVRARETRRTALWRAHGGTRIAKARQRSVLRSSPFRTTSQLGWTALVGASVLVLTAWIAPHLWQKDTTKAPPRVTITAASGAAASSGYDDGYSYGTCCSLEEIEEARRMHFREYFPLASGQDQPMAGVRSTPRVCEPCSRKRAGITASADLDRPYVGKYQPWDAPRYYPPSDGLGGSAPGWDPAQGGPSPYATPPTSAYHLATAATTAASPSSNVSASTPSAYATVTPRRDLPSTPMGAPWRAALLLSAAGIGIHLVLRAARRSLTLRHLTRPFWTETLDQRISNHWERALIGLRDAGVHTTDDEQPLAFASRVGIDGLETCATILERVRHGVRVDASDLDQMNAAATAVYRAARQRAGILARAASWLRPLSA